MKEATINWKAEDKYTGTQKLQTKGKQYIQSL